MQFVGFGLMEKLIHGPIMLLENRTNSYIWTKIYFQV